MREVLPFLIKSSGPVQHHEQRSLNQYHEIQKKIELLQKIAHRFNEANIEWALGASMLLYFKGILSEFHDIDLMISVHDAEQVRTILSEMGELHAPI